MPQNTRHAMTSTTVTDESISILLSISHKHPEVIVCNLDSYNLSHCKRQGNKRFTIWNAMLLSKLWLFFCFALSLRTTSCRQHVISPLTSSERLLLDIRGGSSLTGGSSSFTVRTPVRPLRRKYVGSTPDASRNDVKSTPEDRQAAKEMADAFLTRDSRNSFISRVYAILSCQLLVTAVSVFLFGLNPDLAAWMRRPGLGAAVPILSLLLSTIAWLFMSVSTDARRKSPLKWKVLTLFTLGEAISVGFITSFYKFRSVLTSMGATALVTTTITLYTILQKNPKYDLSQWGATLSS